MEKVIREEQLITIDPDVEQGAPCLCGTSVRLSVLLDNFRQGLSIDEIVDLHPTLTKGAIEKVLANPEQIRRAKFTHRANCIVNLDGSRLTKDEALVQNQVISGEVTTQEAIDTKVGEIKNCHRMQVTQQMVDDAKKIDPEKVRASTLEEIRNLMFTQRNF